MKKLLAACLALTLVGGLSACSHIVYTPVKNEGTVFEQSNIDQVKAGMNKEQILYILGSPNVYGTAGDYEVWTYVTRKIDQRGNLSQRKYQVKFEKNQVVVFGFIDGDQSSSVADPSKTKK